MLRDRLIAGPIMILLALLGCALDAWLDGVASPITEGTLPPGVIITPVAIAIALLAGLELTTLLKETGITASRGLTCGVAMIGVLVAGLVPNRVGGVTGGALVSFTVALVLAGAVVFYARHKRVEGVVAAAGGALLSYALFGLMLGFIVTLRREHPVWIVLWVVLTTKASDIGAFTLGKAIGRHKLIVWLSPKKTWEGLVGAVLLAATVGGMGAWALLAAGVAGSPSIAAGAAVGCLFALMGQAGDLTASVLKRDAGVKDAGTGIPGFGGVIDVVDSLLLVFPAAYWILPLVAANT